MNAGTLLLWYLIGINFLGAALAVYDKIAAKKRPRRRVPENTLLYFALMGGAAGMLIAMLLIRHKTKHKKFTVGLPLILVLHGLLAALIRFFLR